MKKRYNPNAYVLMRVYNPVVSNLDDVDILLNSSRNRLSGEMGPLELRYYERFERAVASVEINNCNLIICDDTPKSNMEEWEKHDNIIRTILGNHGFYDKDKLTSVRRNF